MLTYRMISSISTKKFIFSPEYREGVNDAIDEVLDLQKDLLEEKNSIDTRNKIYDEVINTVQFFLEDNDIEVDWNIEGEIISIALDRAYKKSLEKLNFFRIIKAQLNQKLIERNLRNKIHSSTRFKVMSRDCFRCVFCGDSPATDPKVTLVVDHIQPITKGGKDILGNYQTLCQYCNAGKGNRF